MLLSMLFALIYALLVQNKLGHCKSCLQLPATRIPPFTGGEGYGVVVGGEEIPSYGITTIQGVIPVSGEVGFGGPIHGTGAVSIVAKCGPARSCFLPTVLKFRRSSPVTPVSTSTPIFSADVPVEIPVIRTREPRIETVVPAVPPVVEAVKETPIIGTTRIEAVPGLQVAGEIPVKGTTRLEGAIPTRGEVAFNGVVPAKGTVMITGSFCY